MSVVLTSSPHRAWSRFNFQLSFAHPLRMLQGEFAEGDRISVDAAADALQFVKQQPVTA